MTDLTLNPSKRTFRTVGNLTTVMGWSMPALAGVSYVLVFWSLVSPGQIPLKPSWLEAALVLTAAAATMRSLSRQLPVQNVLLAAAIIGFTGGIAHGLSALTGIPFGGITFTDDAGPLWLGGFAWLFPFLWIIAILSSRGVARLILEPRRRSRTYGYWLIGVTALLAALFGLALDLFASQVKGYWRWQPAQSALAWQGLTPMNFIGWFLIALLVQFLAMPALIGKRPSGGLPFHEPGRADLLLGLDAGQQEAPGARTAGPARTWPPDYHPLVVWLLGLSLFATGGFAHGLWQAGVLCGAIAVTTGTLALRGTRPTT
jgi:uncharacterized membrane protein